MELMEMRMLRWIYGNTLLNKILNMVIRKLLGVDSIIDKL